MILAFSFVYINALIAQSDAKDLTKEPIFNYIEEVDELTADAYMMHTIYIGMPIADLKANFEGLEGWTFKDKGVIDDSGLPTNGHRFSIFRQYNTSTPVYEELRVDADIDNATVKSYEALFYVASDSAGKMIYARIVDNYTKKFGNPNWVNNGGVTIGPDARLTMWYKDDKHNIVQAMYSKCKKEEGIKAQKYYGLPKPLVGIVSIW